MYALSIANGTWFSIGAMTQPSLNNRSRYVIYKNLRDASFEDVILHSLLLRRILPSLSEK